MGPKSDYLLPLAAGIFLLLWLVLNVSTFSLHHRLGSHTQSWPSSAQPKDSRVGLQGRVTRLEQQVSAAEDAFERLVEAAAAAAAAQKQPVSLTKTASSPPSPPRLPDRPQRQIPAPVEETLALKKNVAPRTNVDFAKVGPHPGFAGHPVLAMNDSQFRETPFDAIMSQYGTSGGGGSCDGDFGMGLIHRWRGVGKEYCAARSPTSSSLKCHLVKQTRHHGDGDQLCVGTNLRIDLKDFASPAVTDAIMGKYISSKHSAQPYIKYSRGTLSGTCDLNRELWQKKSFPGWNLDWQQAFETLLGDSESDLQCDAWIEEPTLLVQRDTFANFFHDSEDFFNVFIALAVLKWSTKNLQIIVADLYPKGPFYDIWEKVFAGDRPPLTAWDLKSKYGAKKLCFRNLAVGIFGPASPITVASWRTPCFHTPLVRAYADYVVRGLGLERQTHYAQEAPPKKVVVTWMARRASSQWPERRFCDSENSFFRCEDWQHLDKRSLGRMIRNDQEAVQALKGLEERKWANGAHVQFREADYNLLTFEEQIVMDATTDVMVGPHGAGLLHNIFMPDRATLVELHVDNSGANQHFHNLARWQGRKYVAKTMSNPLDIRELTKTITQVVENIDVGSY